MVLEWGVPRGHAYEQSTSATSEGSSAQHEIATARSRSEAKGETRDGVLGVMFRQPRGRPACHESEGTGSQSILHKSKLVRC